MDADTKKEFHTAANAAGLEMEFLELLRDAERYRFLRTQHWSEASLCVVCDPKEAVKLGRTCPTGEYLDMAVDDAMLEVLAVRAA